MMDILGDTVVCWDYTPLELSTCKPWLNILVRMMIFEMKLIMTCNMEYP